MKGYIYKLTNKITNRIYIGQTKYSVKNRIQSHVCSSKHEHRDVYHSKLARAIRKYGIDSFLLEIVEKVEADTSMLLTNLLNQKEIYYIEIYNSFHNGYNTTSGGGVYIFTEDSKKFMSKRKRDLFTEEKRLNYSLSKTGDKNPMKNKSGSLSPVAKPVRQYTKENIFIKEFVTATEAAKQTNISQKNISCCCTGKLKSAGGFIWKHASSGLIDH